MFITGVTPITLDSLSSGFNIVKNISLSEQFNTMAGFTQKETIYSLEQTIFTKCDFEKRDKIFSKIKNWYNGYLFNVEEKQKREFITPHLLTIFYLILIMNAVLCLKRC